MTSQTVTILRTIDTGGDRVDSIALTGAVFVTAAPRDRDHPLDVTLGVILSCRHADPPSPAADMTKMSVRVSVLGIGRGGTAVQCDRRLVEVGCRDANEQVTLRRFVSRSYAACTIVVFLPNSATFSSGVHEACRDGDLESRQLTQRNIGANGDILAAITATTSRGVIVSHKGFSTFYDIVSSVPTLRSFHFASKCFNFRSAS